MKNKLRSCALALVLGVVIVASACSDDDGGGKSGSREVTFEVTGNFTGDMSTTFITASGGGTTESINNLPWTKTITYESSVPSTQIAVVGAGGNSGENLTVRVIVGGSEESSTSGTATNSGVISVSTPAYAF